MSYPDWVGDSSRKPWQAVESFISGLLPSRFVTSGVVSWYVGDGVLFAPGVFDSEQEANEHIAYLQTTSPEEKYVTLIRSYETI